jgi:phosphatidylserine decarboxylase
MIRIAPEGWPFALGSAGSTIVLALLAWGLVPVDAPLRLPSQVAAVICGVLVIFCLFFFRDPLRTPPEGTGLVLAPADGKIVQIEAVKEPSVLQGEAVRISTFLSVFNVHVQRAPVGGTVVHREYRPGRYLAAWNPKASDENEQASLGLGTGADRILVRQIAGLVARRVVTDPEVGDSIQQGERIGLIRFGSRVDLFIPPHWTVECRKGDHVKGGVTVLARIPTSEGSRTEEEKQP